MITRESLLHIPKSNMSYGYDAETLHIRLRTKKDDVDSVILRIGDPYIWSHGGADGGNLSASNASGWSGGENVSMVKEATTAYYDYWSTFYKPKKKRSRYAFILSDPDESILFGERKIVILDKKNDYALNEMSNFYCFPYLNEGDVHKIPKWVKDVVWYQIFPDRFANGDSSINPKNVMPWMTRPNNDNFMGGDLQGIMDHLDYLKDLGITGIYLCPIFEANTNHRYDTIDYMKIDPSLGDEETFERFVNEAHERGIKIMLDAVFNHMGHLSPMWQDVVKHNENSIYKDWFHIHRFPVYDKPFHLLNGNHLNYETFGRSKAMPKVNTENPEVIEYFLKVGQYWIERFNVDAWRIDVANEVDHQFWRLFRKAVHQVNPEVFLLGEIWHDAQPWLQGDQFDVAMNYPLTEAILQYFCTEEITKNEFTSRVDQVKISYSLQVTENNFNLLDSHDTSRILSIANNNQSKVALAYLFMMSQSGSPCIYYGSEIPMPGEKGHNCEDHRSCMTFNHLEAPFYLFMKHLIHLRNEKPDFKTTTMEWFHLHDQLLSYRKNKTTFILNPTNKTHIVSNLNYGNILMLNEVIKSKHLEFKPYSYIVFEE
ncbi:MAG: alpha-glycosidase [Clostridia bacterium]|nr:alpha-glycosidase [Clostridia bacterium]